MANFAWIGSTILGGYMFRCLLTFQLRGRIYFLTAIISGASAIAISLIVPGNGFIIMASYA